GRPAQLRFPRARGDRTWEPDMSLARLGDLAVGGGVETDVVERTGGQGDSDRGDSGATAVELGVVVALSRRERSYDQPGDEHPPSGRHRYLQRPLRRPWGKTVTTRSSIVKQVGPGVSCLQRLARRRVLDE